ncbi:MAG TPA: SGNH/GDSL hydrolase family protein [Candidatus Omnitrophota bacterium]|nr:SGNH/GDSL hydrolase family protein [Candidatus Omnitrophota bacterium]
MSPSKKMLFAIFSVLLFAAIIEGIAMIVWFSMEQKVFSERYKRGEEQLRNDGINFLKQPDSIYGYRLRPGEKGSQFINQDGFAQRDTVPVNRKPDALRVVTMGESTTHGHNVDMGNYPIYLKNILTEEAKNYSDIEMINAGVAGWISDQVALRAENQTAAYKPDIVILYIGFNDFQSYNPLGPAPRESYFETAYGKSSFITASRFKSVVILNAIYASVVHKISKKWRKAHPASTGATANQPSAPAINELNKYYLASLDRIVAAYKKTNPKVQIAISTLVGRWPEGSSEDYNSPNGATWWMKLANLAPEEAATHMENFNNLIRTYAAEKQLLLIDAENTFKNLDRSKLQWDFAHMHAEGYELLAETMYEKLRDLEIIQGAARPRFQELTAKYKKSAL